MKDCEVNGLMHCNSLIKEGLTVFNSVFANEGDAVRYALDHGIKRIDIVSADGITEKVL